MPVVLSISKETHVKSEIVCYLLDSFGLSCVNKKALTNQEAFFFRASVSKFSTLRSRIRAGRPSPCFPFKHRRNVDGATPTSPAKKLILYPLASTACFSSLISIRAQ